MGNILTEIKFSEALRAMNQSQESKLKRIFIRLKADKKVENQASFGRLIGFSSTAITQMIKGEKPLPFRLLKNLYSSLGVNANFVITEDETLPFYANEILTREHSEMKAKEEGLKLKLSAAERELQDLRQRLVDKEKIIQLLEKKP